MCDSDQQCVNTATGKTTGGLERSHLKFEEFCRTIWTHVENRLDRWCKKRGTEFASLSAKRTDGHDLPTPKQVDRYWSDELLNASLLLIQELKDENKPRELFVVCSFLVLASLEHLFDKVFRNTSNERSPLNASNSAQIAGEQTELMSRCHKIESNLEKFWVVQKVMLDQKRSNVQLISQAVEYTDEILRQWCERETKPIIDPINSVEFPHCTFNCILLNLSTPSSSPLFKYSITLLYGIRHLLLFGLYPVLVAPFPGTSNPTPSDDPALTSLCKLLYLREVNGLCTLPQITALWLHVEEKSELQDCTVQSINDIKIPSFGANVLSSLYKLWRRCVALSSNNREWKERSDVIWSIWVSSVISSLIIYSAPPLSLPSNQQASVSRFRYEKLKQLVELIQQVVQTFSPTKNPCKVTTYCSRDLQYLVDNITKLAPTQSLPQLPPLLLPFMFKRQATPSFCAWIVAVFNLLKCLSSCTVVDTPSELQSICCDTKTLYTQIVDSVVSILINDNSKVPEGEAIEELIHMYLSLLCTSVDLVSQELRSLMNFVSSDSIQFQQFEMFDDLVCQNIFHGVSTSDLRAILLTIRSYFQKIKSVLSVLSPFNSAILELLNKENVNGPKLLVSIVSLLRGRLRRRVIALVSTLYQLLSKMKHRIILCPILSRVNKDDCDKDEGYDGHHTRCLQSVLDDLVGTASPVTLLLQVPDIGLSECKESIHSIPSLLSHLFTSSLSSTQELMSLSLTGDPTSMLNSGSNVSFCCIDQFVHLSNYDETPTPNLVRQSLSVNGLVTWIDFVNKVFLNLCGTCSYSYYVLLWCYGKFAPTTAASYMEFKSFLNGLGKFCQAQLVTEGQEKNNQAIRHLYCETADLLSYASSHIANHFFKTASSVGSTFNSNDIFLLSIEILGLLALRWSFTIVALQQDDGSLFSLKTDSQSLRSVDIMTWTREMQVFYAGETVAEAAGGSFETAGNTTHTRENFKCETPVPYKHKSNQWNVDDGVTDPIDAMNYSEGIQTFVRRGLRIGNSLDKWKVTGAKPHLMQVLLNATDRVNCVLLSNAFVRSLYVVRSKTLIRVLIELALESDGFLSHSSFANEDFTDLIVPGHRSIKYPSTPFSAFNNSAYFDDPPTWKAISTVKRSDGSVSKHRRLRECLLDFIFFFTKRFVESGNSLSYARDFFGDDGKFVSSPTEIVFIRSMLNSAVINLLKAQTFNKIQRMQAANKCEFSKLLNLLSVAFASHLETSSHLISLTTQEKFDLDALITISDDCQTTESINKFYNVINRCQPQWILAILLEYVTSKFFILSSHWKRLHVNRFTRVVGSVDTSTTFHPAALTASLKCMEVVLTTLWDLRVSEGKLGTPRITKLFCMSISLLIEGQCLNLNNPGIRFGTDAECLALTCDLSIFNERVGEILSYVDNRLVGDQSKAYTIVKSCLQQMPTSVEDWDLGNNLYLSDLTFSLKKAKETNMTILVWLSRLTVTMVEEIVDSTWDTRNRLKKSSQIPLFGQQNAERYKSYDDLVDDLVKTLSSEDNVHFPVSDFMGDERRLQYLPLVETIIDILGLSGNVDLCVVDSANQVEPKKQKKEKRTKSNKGQVPAPHISHDDPLTVLSSAIDYKYFRTIFSVIRLILLLRCVPFRGVQSDASYADVVGLLSQAKSWFQLSSELVGLEKQKRRFHIALTRQFLSYSLSAFTSGDRIYRIASQLMKSVCCSTSIVDPIVAELSEYDLEIDQLTEPQRNCTRPVTPRRVVFAEPPKLNKGCVTPKRRTCVSEGLRRVDDETKTPVNKKKRNRDELNRLFGDVMVQRLSTLETMGKVEEFELQLEELKTTFMENENYHGLNLRVTTAIQFAITISKFHSWAYGEVHLALLAASEAMAECVFLYRAMEKESLCAAEDNNEDVVHAGDELRENRQLSEAFSEAKTRDYRNGMSKNQSDRVTLTCWDINNNLLGMSMAHQTNWWCPKRRRKQNEEGYYTPRQNGTRGTPLPTRGYNADTDDGSSSLNDEHCKIYQSSRSRDLFHVVSLIIQASSLQATLWASIGSAKRVVHTCTSALSIISRRIQFPLTIVDILLHIVETQVQRLSFDYSDGSFFDKDASAIIDVDGADSTRPDRLCSFTYDQENIDGMVTVRQRETRLLLSCFSLAAILSPVVIAHPRTFSNAVSRSQRFASLWPIDHSFYASVNRILNHFQPSKSTEGPLIISYPFNADQFVCILENIIYELSIKHISSSGQPEHEGSSLSSHTELSKPSRVCRKGKSSMADIIDKKDQCGTDVAAVFQSISLLIDAAEHLLSSKEGAISSAVRMADQLDRFLSEQRIANCMNIFEDMLQTPTPTNAAVRLIRITTALLISLIAMKLCQACLNQSLMKSCGSTALDTIHHFLRLQQQQTLPQNIQSTLRSIVTSIIILQSQHLRCYWTFRFRHHQKLSNFSVYKTRPASASVAEDVIEFLLRHHLDGYNQRKRSSSINGDHTSKGTALQDITQTTSYLIDPEGNAGNSGDKVPVLETIPVLWTVVHLEVQINNNYKRLRCWRYFGSKIIGAIVGNICTLNSIQLKTSKKGVINSADVTKKDAPVQLVDGTSRAKRTRGKSAATPKISSDNVEKGNLKSAVRMDTHWRNAELHQQPPKQVYEVGHWVYLCTDWIEGTVWNMLERQIDELKRRNVTSTTNSTTELPTDKENRKGDKRKAHKWWNQRFAVQADLTQWIDQLEMLCLGPILPWICGWPTTTENMQSVLRLISEGVDKFLTVINKSITDDNMLSQLLPCRIREQLVNKEVHHKQSVTESLDLRLCLTVLTLATAARLIEIKHTVDSVTDPKSDSNYEYFKHHMSCLGRIILSSLSTSSNEMGAVSILPTDTLPDYCNIGRIFWNSLIDGPVALISTNVAFESTFVTTAVPSASQKIAGSTQPTPKHKSRSHKRTDKAPPLSSVSCDLDYPLLSSSRLPKYFPVVLFLSSSDLFSYQVPWDSLSLLSHQNITIGVDLQLFSFIFQEWNLSSRVLNPHQVKHFLIVNPSGDISTSKNTIPSQILNATSARGFFNRPPNVSESLEQLTMSDVYVYCGHGGGTQFISPEAIQVGHVNPELPYTLRGSKIKSIALLLGCGSIYPSLEYQGENEEVDSLAMDFLIAGSPSVFGLLWHVTDLDLDRFTSKWLSSWLETWSIPLQLGDSDITDPIVEPLYGSGRWGSLTEAKRLARSACLLRLVTGGACVCVGLPF